MSISQTGQQTHKNLHPLWVSLPTAQKEPSGITWIHAVQSQDPPPTPTGWQRSHWDPACDKRASVKLPTATQCLTKPIHTHTDPRAIPVWRHPLCLCTGDYPAAQTVFGLWPCPPDGSGFCPCGWSWRHSWGWSGGWWCWRKPDFLPGSPAPSGLPGNSGLWRPESGAGLDNTVRNNHDRIL